MLMGPHTQRGKSPSSGVFNDSYAGYADDLVLNSWNIEDLQIMAHTLNDVLLEFGLQVNSSKTETVIWNWKEDVDGPYPDSILQINNKSILNSKYFKYLGVWIEYNDIHIGQRETENRLNSAKAAFAENKSLLMNHSIRLHTRIKFLNGLVRSRLTYGCHSWRPTEPEINKIDSTYNRFLRRMVRHGFDRINPPSQNNVQSEESDHDNSQEQEPDWRYEINNETLHNITKTVSIREYFEQQQHNWISHCIRRDNDEVSKMLTFHTTMNRLRGRSSASILQRVVKRSSLDRGQFLRNCFSGDDITLNSIQHTIILFNL